MTDELPTPAAIAAAAERLGPHLRVTPTWEWRDELWQQNLGHGAEVLLKLELFQHAGSFKPRGALTVMLALPPERLRQGVTAVSAGNHAAAVAFAARTLGVRAKVVMPRTADPARVALSRAYGADVVLTEDVHAAFEEVNRIEREEGCTFVHPFEGPLTALGTATLGMEFLGQAGRLDAMVVPIGGGGLCAGVAAAVKQLQPDCLVLGVEPEGNDVVSRSLASGKPEQATGASTIADSLSPPYALPYSLGLMRQFVDDVVLISDTRLQEAMYVLFARMKLAVEPAGAASTAALLGPLAPRLRGKRVGLVVCGSNIDRERFSAYLQSGAERWASR